MAIIIIAKSGIIIVNQFERGIVERWGSFAKSISKDIQKEYSGYLESDWLNYLVFGTAMGVVLMYWFGGSD